MLIFQELRQQQEAMRQQLLLQSQQQQQQSTTFFSGCFGTLYRHLGLLEPQLPTTQQLQFDPSGPPPPIGGFVQTPLASYPMSPLLQTGVFGSPAPAPGQQQYGMTEEQRALFLQQQEMLRQFQHPSAQPLPVTTLTFEPIRPIAVRPSSADTLPVSSAPLMDSTSVVTEAVASTAPPTSLAPPPTTTVSPTVSSGDSDADPDCFIVAPSQSTPSSPPQE